MAAECQAPEHDFNFKDESSAMHTPAIDPDVRASVDDESQDEEIRDRKSDSLWWAALHLLGLG